MEPAGAFPLLATGSVRPVFPLPSLQPRSAVANPPPPLTGSIQPFLKPFDISGHFWTARSLPCGRQAVVFPASLATDNLGPVCPGCDQTGVLPLFSEATPIVFVSCGDSITQAAVQMTSTVGRGFVPPTQEGRGDCGYVTA